MKEVQAEVKRDCEWAIRIEIEEHACQIDEDDYILDEIKTLTHPNHIDIDTRGTSDL